jgi:hypothetical protein
MGAIIRQVRAPDSSATARHSIAGNARLPLDFDELSRVAPSRRTRSPHRGYVLIVTLGLLVLSASLLVAIGHAAVRHALAARLAADRLQRHWGQVSCSKAVLPFAEGILINAELELHQPVAVYHARLQLGDQLFTLIISDEQAKANVNSMLEMASEDKFTVESRIRQALSGSGLPPAAIRLHLAKLPSRAATQPAGQPGDSGLVRQWVSGLGQIFDDVPPEKLLQGVAHAPVEQVTCFGSGGTNMMRAPESALVLAAAWSSLTQSDISSIIEMRNARLAPRGSGARQSKGSSLRAGSPSIGRNTTGLDAIGALLSAAGVTVKDRRKLPFVAGSTCHSLWIIIGDPQSGSHYLAVSDESNPKVRRIQSFVW